MDRITTSETVGYQLVRAPRGIAISCKSWQQEAALRMLMNSLDPEVAHNPAELIVCGRVKAARNWECFHAIVASLRSLGNDETLLVQSGKPIGIFRTNMHAPRVLAANAGSWFHIGAQGVLQEAFEVFAAAGRKHFQGDFAGKLVVSGGMGAMGGVQPLAATLNGAAFLGIDANPEQIKRRVKSGYCDVMVNDLDEALRILKNAVRKREATSVECVTISRATFASEHASRMAAMENATSNCGEMIDHLTLVYNKTRQQSITNEMMDIVGGAEALQST